MKMKSKKLKQKKIESAKRNFWSLLFLISVFVSFFGLVGLMASEKEDTNASSQQTEKIYYFHNDHLGTSIKLTNQAGNVVWEMQDGPFGEEPLTVKPNSITMNLRFPGQYYDDETGLFYNIGRYYNPKLARYMTPDPVGGSRRNPQSFNPYPYVANNPINYSDPFGLWTSEGHRELSYQANGMLGTNGLNSNDLNTIENWNVYTDIIHPIPIYDDPYHYMPGTQNEAENFINNQLRKAVELYDVDKNKALEELGEGLHTVQDRYAHYEQNYGWEEHIETWLYYDKPQNSPTEFYFAERASYNYLNNFLKRLKERQCR